MSKPNFVFIMTDTQGANVVGCYGHPELQTPNIDRLAAEGIKFENGYTTCPVCTPARGGIFTGSYPHTNGAWTNNMPLLQNIKTVGQRFSDNGYHSAYIGKWHLDGHDYFGLGECPAGWDADYWYEIKNYLDDLSGEEVTLWRSGLKSIEDLEENNITREFTFANHVSNKAIDFLQEASQEKDPFLLVVSYDEPHGPATCPPEYAKRFEDHQYPLGPGAFDDLKDKPEHQRLWADKGQYYREEGFYQSPLYFGCNSFVDSEIGRVIDAVDRLIPDDTYIIYTSDHGDMMGSHGISSKGPAMYEEITHIPYIIRKPGGQDGGLVDTTPVSHIDILPTMLELAGLKVPLFLDGESLMPIVNGEEKNLNKPAFIEFLRHTTQHDSYGGFQPIRCIVKNDVKLVINLLYSDELYDLKKDPSEVTNLINDPAYKEIREELHADLLEWMYESVDPFRTMLWERRPWSDSKEYGFKGKYRPYQDDGYKPSILLYGTGKPPESKNVDPGKWK